MDTDMRIIALYKEYNMVIKPLIAELEARTERFPLPLFNEIRALHDHIVRCYSERISSNQVDSEIHKAERHVTRIMLDCYKCLNLSLHDEVLLFERPMQVLLWILSAIASGVISIILAKYL